MEEVVVRKQDTELEEVDGEENVMMNNQRLFGVFAYPVKHSLSPLMHNAAFRAVKLEHHYQGFEIHPDLLENAVAALRTLHIGGVNVTIPHKQAIMPLLDEIDLEAQMIGAVNTVVRDEQGRLKGYNTDGAGYVQSLLAETSVQLSSAKVLLVGAGGAAKGIAVYLLKMGCPEIMITNRTTSRAEELAGQLQQYSREQSLDAQVSWLDWPEVQEGSWSANVIIQTTSIGMWPHVEESPLPKHLLHKDMIVSDIVYNPLETKLLQEAKQQGAEIHHGLGMFIYQGAIAFKYFTGVEAPVERMREVVLEKLREGG